MVLVGFNTFGQVYGEIINYKSFEEEVTETMKLVKMNVQNLLDTKTFPLQYREVREFYELELEDISSILNAYYDYMERFISLNTRVGKISKEGISQKENVMEMLINDKFFFINDIYNFIHDYRYEFLKMKNNPVTLEEHITASADVNMKGYYLKVRYFITLGILNQKGGAMYMHTHKGEYISDMYNDWGEWDTENKIDKTN